MSEKWQRILFWCVLVPLFLFIVWGAVLYGAKFMLMLWSI